MREQSVSIFQKTEADMRGTDDIKGLIHRELLSIPNLAERVVFGTGIGD